MPWRRPRYQLFLCAIFDVVGCIVLAAVLDIWKGSAILRHSEWLAPFVLGYLLFGWLFGSYTVLRWPWLRLRLVLFRLFLTALATMGAVILVDWAFNISHQVVFTHRSTQFALLIGLTIWSLLLRLAFRWLTRIGGSQQWCLLAAPQELQQIQKEWVRSIPLGQEVTSLISVEFPLDHGQERNVLNHPLRWRPRTGLVVGSELKLAPDQEKYLQALSADGVEITSIIDLAEQQLERLPPALLPKGWLKFSELRWADSFSVQRQLKRAADVVFSLCLLLLTFPLVVFIGLLIKLEDHGPVFYVQRRSGLMGTPFWLLKLRTMCCQPADAAPSWTIPGDCRITRVGFWLRRTRLDELPQLINVLRGEMSLIGPRPERPELEEELERRIPHYLKRHWMRPGLSGWAQVSAPYASSIEEAELKLSYDLYYLRNWNCWLDLLILAKTIKTVLKAKGR